MKDIENYQQLEKRQKENEISKGKDDLDLQHGMIKNKEQEMREQICKDIEMFRSSLKVCLSRFGVALEVNLSVLSILESIYFAHIFTPCLQWDKLAYATSQNCLFRLNPPFL